MPSNVFSRVESTSQPEWVINTSSSMRTPPSPGKVDARFDGDDHARAEFFVAAGLAQGGQFMHFSPDAMAQAVPELILESRPLDDIAGDAIGPACVVTPGRKELDGGLLGIVDQLCRFP